MEGGISMTTALTTAIGDIISIFTTNVTPLLTTAPMVYFLAAALFGLGVSVFRRVMRAVKKN